MELLIPLVCLLCETFGGLSEGRELQDSEFEVFFIPFAEVR